MVMEEMRPLRSLLSARAETGDNYLFRTPLPHMSNLTAEQLQAFKTIANVDSSVLLQSPPGSGKSFVLGGILQWWKQERSHDRAK